jgi:hypothetical protein
MWSEGLCRIYLVHKDQWRFSAKMAIKIPNPTEVGNIRKTEVLFYSQEKLSLWSGEIVG